MRIWYVLVFIAWSLTSFQLAAVFNYGITSIDICLGLFYIAAAKQLLWDGKVLHFSLNLPLLCLLALIPAVLISGFSPLLAGQGAGQFFKSGIHFVFVWLFAVLAAGLDEPPRFIERIVRVLLFYGLLVALFGIYQVIARAFDLPLAWLEVTNVSVYHARNPSDIHHSDQLALQFENFFRATSIFSEPSVLAVFTSTLLMFLGVPYFQGRKPFFRSRVFNGVLLVAFVTVLLLTFSLTGFASVMVLVLLVLLLESGKRRLKLLLGIALIGLILVIADGFIQPVTKVSILDLFARRITNVVGLNSSPYAETISGESFDTRQGMLETSVRVWGDYPINGVGLGLFSEAEAARKAGLQFSVSSFFSVMAELGSIGALFFFALFISLIYSALRHHCGRYREPTERLLGLLPYLFGLLVVHNFIGNSFVLPGLWLYIGLAMAILNIARKESGLPRVQFALVRRPLKQYFRHSARAGVRES